MINELAKFKRLVNSVGNFIKNYRYAMPAIWFFVALLIPLIFHDPALALYRSDAFEYLRGADTLFSGQGYLSINGHVQTLFPPGYSLAIAGFKLFVPSTPQAGVLVSLVASALSVTLVYFIANAWFGRRVAFFSALLFSFYPLRVWLAQSVLSESLEVMWVLLGIFALSGSASWLRGAVSGVFLGLAYLTRPEALIVIFCLFVWALLLIAAKKKTFAIFFSAVLFALITAAPYFIWYHAQTATWSFSGKDGVIKLGLLREETKQDIEWRVLNAEKTKIQVREPDFSLQKLIPYYARNVWRFKEQILRNSGVEPFAGLLLVFGFLSSLTLIFRTRAWNAAILQLGILSPLFIFPLFWVEDRFIYQISPLLALWTSAGIVALYTWAHSTWSGNVISQKLWGKSIIAICLIAILGSFVFRLATTNMSPSKIQMAQEMAQILRDKTTENNIGIISEYSAIAYFLGARAEFTPNADLTALRTFATTQRSQFVVVANTDILTPATKQLLDGDFLPQVAEQLGEVKQGDLHWMLYYLHPLTQ